MASEREGSSEETSIPGLIKKVNFLIQELRDSRDDALVAKEEKEKSEERGIELDGEIKTTLLEMEEFKIAIADIESKIKQLREDLSVNVDLLAKKNDYSASLGKIKGENLEKIEVKKELLESAISAFKSKESEISSTKGHIIRSIEGSRTMDKDSATRGKIGTSNDGKFEFEGLVSLGDIHGWAPGLFNYLASSNLADSSFGDFQWGTFEFPEQFKWRPNATRFLSPPGLDANPQRPNSHPTIFRNLVVSPKHGTKPRLILIGDLIDRGDHSELVVEAVRQMVTKSSGGCFSLIGNHEAMIIQNDFETWRKNEKRYISDGVPGRPFTVAHDPLVTGEGTIEEGLLRNFSALRCSIGALLLTQHFSLLNSLSEEGKKRLKEMTKSTWKKTKTNVRKLEKVVNLGGWELYMEGGRFLDAISTKAVKTPMIIPGAIVSWYEAGNFFLHAEPSGIAELGQNFHDRTSGIGSMQDIWELRGSEIRFQLAAIENGPAGRLEISQGISTAGRGRAGGLLWARDDDTYVGTAKGVSILRGMLPELTDIIHGHSAGPSTSFRDFKESESIVRVHNIDESIGPNPRFDSDLEDPYCTKTTPNGWSIG